jgi:hypothetical protein
MNDELLHRLFQRHLDDPDSALHRLNEYLAVIDLPFDLKGQLRELQFPPQPSLPNGMPSFIYYFVPGSRRGTDQRIHPLPLHPSFLNSGDGIGLNLGCPVRLLRALDALMQLSPIDQRAPRDALRHGAGHLSAVEELLWLTGWKSPTSIRRGGMLPGQNGDIDWGFQADGNTIYLEAKFRRSDWARLSDGEISTELDQGYLSSAAHKFPHPSQVNVLHIVGITTFDNINEEILHRMGHELEAAAQIHAVVNRSLLGMAHVISLSVEIRDRVLGLLETPKITDFPVNHGVIYDRVQRDTRVASRPEKIDTRLSNAVCWPLAPVGVLPFPIPEPDLYRFAISSRGPDGEPHFKIIPKFILP